MSTKERNGNGPETEFPGDKTPKQGAIAPSKAPQVPAPETLKPASTIPQEDSSSSWSARPVITFGLIVLVILVGGFGGWAVTSRLAGAVIATGAIEVDQNRQVVQHLDGGVVDQILVDDGDTVAAGDILIQLDGTVLNSDLAIVEGQLFELMARRGRLAAERDALENLSFDMELLAAAADDGDVATLVSGQERLFHARRESLDRELAQLDKRRDQISELISGIDAQQTGLDLQLELLSEELGDQRKLMESGLAQKSRLLALQREEASLTGRLGELKASRAENEGRITELEIEALKLEGQRREEAISRLRDLQYREFELAEQRQALKEQISRLDIRAPVSGIIHSMAVFAPRSVIRPADPVLYIIPQDRPLVIAARVEPIHIDQIFPGQEVMLRFSALDSRTTPELKGLVDTISADALIDENSGISYYRAEVLLQAGEIEKLPEGIVLLPGMPVESFLQTEERTPLAYLMKPLSDYFVKAFRES